MPETQQTKDVKAWLETLENALTANDIDARRTTVRRGQLLA